MIAGTAVLVMLSGIVLLTADYAASMTKLDGGIIRNAYGEGSSTEVLDVIIEGRKERIPVEIEVAEQRYTADEIQEMFDRVIRKLESEILNGNESLARVEQDLDLVTAVPEEPVDISWELDRYDVMNIQGEIQEDALESEGTLVTLNAVLTYREDETKQAAYQCTAHLYPLVLSGEEARKQEIEETLAASERKNREEKDWNLPEAIRGKAVSYYRQMDERGLVLIIMALLVISLLIAQKKQDEMQEEARRSRQMIRDYPEIIGKLTLYLGAGMTVKRAFRKVVEEYERQKKTTGVRCAYEEMQKTCREMESGHTEAESYENFGRRCKVQAYVRFGALLSQNLRKGTRGLTELLKMEAIQAFEDRKARARRLGEEAGTKLLLPMFLMLTVVLVIVIVPAFLSMQIL